jgi:alginate O-acetyltransferase complex protein AlgJ
VTGAEGPRWSLLTRLTRDGKVVRGRDGWLFLANDTNDVMSQHAGTRTLSAEEMERWVAVLEERTQRLGERDVPYICLIAPDTHAVYREKLPAGFEPARERSIHRLLQRLGDGEFAARVIYPLEELVREKPKRWVYSAFDSHWTEFGALVAYRRLMKDVSDLMPVRQLDPADITFTDQKRPAELLFKIGVERDIEHLHASFPVHARLVDDNEVENQGSFAVLECDDAPPTTCVLFGDSYTHAMLPFLAESFRRLVFAHTPWLDYELIERERPDIVISLFAERFLIYVADDSYGITIEDLASKKLAEGATRPRMPMWD